MKRIIILLVTVLMLNGCGMVDVKVPWYDDSAEVESRTMGKITEAIVDKDKEALMSIFSEKAKSEVDLDSSIEDFLNVFEEKELVCEESTGPIVYESLEDGEKTEIIDACCEVKGERNNYIFCFRQYVTDTGHPQNQGVYSLRIIREQDEEQQLRDPDEMALPGIYYHPLQEN